MKKLVIGFFLSLLIILCGSYTQAYANSLKENAIFTPDRIVKASLPGTEKDRHSSDATVIEEEDDQQTSTKKYVNNSPASTLIYSDNVSSIGLQFCTPVSHSSSSPSYILFKVFRV